MIADTGYQGLQKLYKNTLLPIRRKRNTSLTKEEKKYNKELSKQRMLVEPTVGEAKI
mgnify:CR=1 FL=1